VARRRSRCMAAAARATGLFQRACLLALALMRRLGRGRAPAGVGPPRVRVGRASGGMRSPERGASAQIPARRFARVGSSVGRDAWRGSEGEQRGKACGPLATSITDINRDRGSRDQYLGRSADPIEARWHKTRRAPPSDVWPRTPLKAWWDPALRVGPECTPRSRDGAMARGPQRHIAREDGEAGASSSKRHLLAPSSELPLPAPAHRLTETGHCQIDLCDKSLPLASLPMRHRNRERLPVRVRGA
jgi:hypothetical protein